VNFLVDAQLPPRLARWLADQGHSAQHVNDIGLAGAEDSVIWNHALGINAIIVTKDEDFAERTARTAVGPVIVWLRIGNATNVPFSNGWNHVGLLSFNYSLTAID
jgi:predicted nuclease of predicted toxin-antitoxin system